MRVKFFLYSKAYRFMHLFLESVPENNFESEQRVIVDGRKVAAGIDWNKVGAWYNPEGVVLDDPYEFDKKYLYDEATEEISLNPQYSEPEVLP